MKTDLYNYALRSGRIKRRDLLKSAGAMGTLAAFSGVATGMGARPVWAQDNASLRAEILKIPGVGAGSPTDADWQ